MSAAVSFPTDAALESLSVDELQALLRDLRAKGEPPRYEDGRQLLLDGTPEHLADVRDETILDAIEAREDIVKFFDFVMEEQTTRAPVTAAAHQRLAMRFAMDHAQSVHMWPPGTSKTFMAVAITLFLLGQDPTHRGAIVSATQTQASQVLLVVRSYIESSWRLWLVFPHLRRTQRDGEKWTQTAITVDRPYGIADASLVALGEDNKGVPGKRLSWVVVDDLLNLENTATKDQRDKTERWFQNTLLSRLDLKRSRIIVINTPYDIDDLVHRLEKPIMDGGSGWPTLRMTIYGDIRIKDDEKGEENRDREIRAALEKGEEPPPEWQPWDSDEIRPTQPLDPSCRLVAHDPDPNNDKVLWPEKFDFETIEGTLRRRHLPREFNMLYKLEVRDDGSAMCQQAYVDLGKRLARDRGYHSMGAHLITPGMATFTGVDLAIDVGEENDFTAFVTFGILPDLRRLILDVEFGQWPGPVILRKVLEKQRRFQSVVAVENNGAQQYIVQFANDPMFRTMLAEESESAGAPAFDVGSLAVKGQHTGRQKAHPQFGVAAIFLEMSNGAWLFPNSPSGHTQKPLEELLSQCLYYAPAKHTGDILMAMYMAAQLARKWGLLSGGDTAALAQGQGGGIASFMTR